MELIQSLRDCGLQDGCHKFLLQIRGQILVLVIVLHIEQRGTANRSGNFMNRAGNISSLTMDLGFLNAQSPPATWYGSKIRRCLSLVTGISPACRGSNSQLMALKWLAKSSPPQDPFSPEIAH